MVSAAARRGRVQPSAVRGLEWVAGVGPSPLAAVAAALGWSDQLSWRWSRQLVAAGWVERMPMTRGEGSLLFATSAGAEMAGGEVGPPRPPAPTWWAHLVACAWTAAWFTSRGRPIQAPREVDLDERWRGQIRWRDGHGQHEVGHRPDLAWVPDGARIGVEVELARKSTPRLEAILDLHAAWRAAGETAGVIYICRTVHGRERVIELAGARGLTRDQGGGLRVELLDDVQRQAIQAGEALRAERTAKH
jgi:hypothetical protein